MNLKISCGLAVCGSLLVSLSLFGAVRSQKTQDPEGARLIESIPEPALFGVYCAACHDQDGKGGGPVARSLKVTAPDLTRIAARNGGTFPLARIQSGHLG